MLGNALQNGCASGKLKKMVIEKKRYDGAVSV